MITESLVPIGNDIASLGLMLTSIIYLVCYALIAAFCGIASSWIGFRKQSVIATIVASCIIMVTMCQIVAMTFFFWSGDDIAFGWYGNYYIFSR